MEKNKNTVIGNERYSKDGTNGGIFNGDSHKNGGIAAINIDTNQPIEVEGNEIIINKKSVADQEKREFEGEMLTNREILSKINEGGGGVSFEDGGKVDYDCECDEEMADGGQTTSSTDKLINYLKENGELNHGRDSIAKDGTKYRYDRYSTKGESANNLVVSLFEKAAQENGNRYATQFNYKDVYSISYDRPKYKNVVNGKISMTELVESDKMADGGELDTHSELRQFFQEQNTPIVVEEPIVETIIEEEIVELPTEIMLFKEELTTDEDAPMIYVGSSIYANNSNGTDEWIVKSFTQDGINLTHIPSNPLNYKHDDKHLTFEELTTLFKNKSISIKFVLNDRELNLILMILKDKLQNHTSFKSGGVVFIDKEGSHDEEIMESQFGNKKF